MMSSTNLPRRGFIGDLLGFHIRIAQLDLFAAFGEAVGDATFTPLLAGALYLIAENPGANQSDLAALLVADPSTMVRLIDQLVRRGWVVRKTAEHDRRSTVPRLTPAGRAILERISPAVLASEERVAASLTALERATLLSLLKRLTTKPSTAPELAG